MSWKNWVIDATLQSLHDDVMLPGTFTFIPVEGEFGTAEAKYVVGMMYVSDKPPHDGKVVGVFHEDGQEAVEQFCEQHKEHLKPLGFV